MSDHAVSSRRSTGIACLLRGWLIASLTVILAAGGHQAAHSLMHGATETIPLQLLIFSAALTAPVAVVLTARRVSVWSTAATTLFGQVVFHFLYSLPYTGFSTVSSGHDHHEPLAHPVVRQAPVVDHVTHPTAVSDAAMLAGHFLAAALTTVVITHGERSLTTLAHWLTLTPVRIVLAARPVIPGGPATTLAAVPVWIPHPMNVAQTRSSRGPPVLA